MPSSSLQGMTTPCGWQVVELIQTKQPTGGNFCNRYLVKDDNGLIAFMKAMDLSRVMNGSLHQIQSLIGEYLFEREILHYCKEENMTKVVVPLSAGELENTKFPPPLNKVYYIVFEKAEEDLRQKYLSQPCSDWSSFFKAMHHVCIATEQLHRAGIAHQDIKPSNILHFIGDESKIGDLGRVADRAGRSPFLDLAFPGDHRYAPVEFWLGIRIDNFQDRYLTDVYSVGNLVYQALMGVTITHALVDLVQKTRPNIFSLSYKEALPYVVASFSIIIEELFEISEKKFGKVVAERVSRTVNEMCFPDYTERGSPKYKDRQLKLNMRRYTSQMAEIVRLLYIEEARNAE